MDYQALTTFISSIGFPIAACVAMFYYLKEESKTHKEEVDSLRDALENNTKVVAELKQMLVDLRRD